MIDGNAQSIADLASDAMTGAQDYAAELDDGKVPADDVDKVNEAIDALQDALAELQGLDLGE